MKTRCTLAITLALLLPHAASSSPSIDKSARPLAELQRDLVNLRFGMFIHFSPTTYVELAKHIHPDHAPPRQGIDGVAGTADDISPNLVSPAKLDCGQWADAAESAKMGFAVLTTKHHDGFRMWPSKYSDYTVTQGCKRDIVREFTDAFRSRGLKVGLYYSIRDRTSLIADDKHGGASREKIELIKNELTELLTNYGDILYIVFDGWGNTWHESPTFTDIPYPEIRAHIKSLQPNCIISNHSRVRSLSDVLHIEVNAGMSLPSGSDWPAIGGTTLQGTWFWRPEYPAKELQSVDWIVNQHLIPYNQRNVVFQLNCAPNRDGLMDANVVARLAEVGKDWNPPPPLANIPASWNHWPVPEEVKLFDGKNLVTGKSAQASPDSKNLAALTDGDPETFTVLRGPNGWFEIDLGESYDIAGIHLWNQPTLKSVMLDQGWVLVSDNPIHAETPQPPDQTPGVTAIRIAEPPGYPSPLTIGARGRYIRVISDGPQSPGISEIEVFKSKQP